MNKKFPIYLDHAATTPILPEVYQSMKPFLTTEYGNPSSSYQLGERAQQAIHHARVIIAESIHAQPDEIYFTSGGTESDNWAVKGSFWSTGCSYITSMIEHPAMLRSLESVEQQGARIHYVPVDKDGRVSLDKIEEVIQIHEESKEWISQPISLISIMYANNEIGTIQPIEQIGELANKYHLSFHTDAVQAYGHIPIDVTKNNITMLSVSGHKLGGPKGIGFLYVSKSYESPVFIHGGGQERGKRSGTENVAGIVGLGKAAEYAMTHMEQNNRHIEELRNYLYKRLVQLNIPIKINGCMWNDSKHRLPNNVNIQIKNCNNQALVAYLDQHDICVSAGSACASNKKTQGSHVLSALGLTREQISNSIRITLGEDNTKKQIDYFLYVLKQYIDTF